MEKGKPIRFELNEEQSQRYWDWVESVAKQLAEHDEILEDATISFVFSPYGREVIAHTGGLPIGHMGPKIILYEEL